uniref:hypothetical protein n=1 Tax=Alistipes sp. TaxID=1872444 RepID=UPI0040573789
MAKVKDGVVKLHERVEIIGTGKSSFLPKGATFKVHPINADALVKAGKAELKKAKEE